eukprot:15282720-Alexandrium_andersonii.AAC.1
MVLSATDGVECCCSTARAPSLSELTDTGAVRANSVLQTRRLTRMARASHSVIGTQLIKPVRKDPGGVLEDPRHTPGGGIRRDVIHGRGVPLEAVGLLEIAVHPEQERGDPHERRPHLAGGDGGPVEEAVRVGA